MKCTNVKVISDGVMKMDGGSMFGLVPKVAWESCVTTDRKNRISLGLNCLLLQTLGKNVLVDTGVGCKDNDMDDDSIVNVGMSHGKLLKGLKECGLTSKDIDAVILSHLHFDHSGGCTRMNRAGERRRYLAPSAGNRPSRTPSSRSPRVISRRANRPAGSSSSPNRAAGS